MDMPVCCSILTAGSRRVRRRSTVLRTGCPAASAAVGAGSGIARIRLAGFSFRFGQLRRHADLLRRNGGHPPCRCRHSSRRLSQGIAGLHVGDLSDSGGVGWERLFPLRIYLRRFLSDRLPRRLSKRLAPPHGHGKRRGMVYIVNGGHRPKQPGGAVQMDAL